MPASIRVQAPASKSLSHRALICAALAVGESRLTRVLESDDTARTMDCLRAMGASIEPVSDLGPGCYTVRGMNGTPMGAQASDPEPVSLNMGESGTSCRLLTAVAALGIGDFRVHGEGRMHQRPIGELTEALRELKVAIEFENREGYPPFVIRGAGMMGGVVGVSLEESSQYLSGLLLAAPLARRPITLEITGSKVRSWPYVGLTLDTMEAFGAKFRVKKQDAGHWAEVPWREQDEILPGAFRFEVVMSMYYAKDLAVEGDWSNASYFLAAGALGPRPVTVEGLNPASLQGDRAIADIVSMMGAEVRMEEGGVTVVPGPLKGVDVDMGHCPDLAPTVGALAAFAQGPTRVSGVPHLRIKESDRLAGVASQLRKLGAAVEEFEDGMAITPGGADALPKSLDVETFDDHRMAMAFSLPRLKGLAVDYDNPGCVAKSFPDFFARFDEVLG